MAICCWLNSKKSYAYEVGKFCGGWRMKKVVVQECRKCGSKTVTRPKDVFEREDYLCDTLAEVGEICIINGIPLLRDLV